MGCDIHICLEVHKDGKWVPLVRMIPNKWYDAEHEKMALAEGRDYWETQETQDTVYEGRNYDLFAILADVRNGRGFAGCDTGNGFLPIAFPKGIPSDAHPDTVEFLNSFGCDGHSHSWHTLEAFEKYNWDMTAKHRGWVGVIEYAIFKQLGHPTSWSGGVSGQSIHHVPVDEMEPLYQKHKEFLDPIAKSFTESGGGVAFMLDERISGMPEELKGLHTQVQWESSYRESAGSFLTHSLPRLRQLAQEEGVGPSDVRMLFFFDN